MNTKKILESAYLMEKVAHNKIESKKRIHITEPKCLNKGFGVLVGAVVCL